MFSRFITILSIAIVYAQVQAQERIGYPPLPPDSVVSTIQEASSTDACPDLSGSYKSIGSGIWHECTSNVCQAPKQLDGVFILPVGAERTPPINEEVPRPAKSAIHIRQTDTELTITETDQHGTLMHRFMLKRGVAYSCESGYLLYRKSDAYIGGEHGGYKAGTRQNIYAKSTSGILVGIEYSEVTPTYLFGLFSGQQRKMLHVVEFAQAE